MAEKYKVSLKKNTLSTTLVNSGVFDEFDSRLINEPAYIERANKNSIFVAHIHRPRFYDYWDNVCYHINLDILDKGLEERGLRRASFLETLAFVNQYPQKVPKDSGFYGNGPQKKDKNDLCCLYIFYEDKKLNVDLNWVDLELERGGEDDLRLLVVDSPKKPYVPTWEDWAILELQRQVALSGIQEHGNCRVIIPSTF